jgi:hypothetical protein
VSRPPSRCLRPLSKCQAAVEVFKAAVKVFKAAVEVSSRCQSVEATVKASRPLLRYAAAVEVSRLLSKR